MSDEKPKTRPWKRAICRCGWHSESYRHRTDRIEGQCKIHWAQCQQARDSGLEEELTGR